MHLSDSESRIGDLLASRVTQSQASKQRAGREGRAGKDGKMALFRSRSPRPDTFVFNHRSTI